MGTGELAFVGVVAGAFGAALATLLDGFWWRRVAATVAEAGRHADRAELAEMTAEGYLRQVRESLADRDDLVVLVPAQPTE